MPQLFQYPYALQEGEESNMTRAARAADATELLRI
ncbi:unnamed protein product [Victoria cruziana]